MEENVFSTPMQLRKWALNLIEQLGNPMTQKGPNTREIDRLLAQFVNDYNYQYTLQQEQEEE